MTSKRYDWQNKEYLISATVKSSEELPFREDGSATPWLQPSGQQKPQASFVQRLLCSSTYCRKHETITSSRFQTNSDLRMEAIFILLRQFLNDVIYRGYFGRFEKRTQTSVCGDAAPEGLRSHRFSKKMGPSHQFSYHLKHL